MIIIETNKPVILAICGKSCTGKSSLVNFLVSQVSANTDKNVCKIIGSTTRPRRNKETESDYNFLETRDFLVRAINEEFLEYTKFRNWYYGTPKLSIKGDINIGVFNAKGIISLLKHQDKYCIIPIYLEDKTMLRLRRSWDREERWRFEFIRRIFADWKDFFDFRSILQQYPHRLKIKNTDGTMRKVSIIISYLKRNKFL